VIEITRYILAAIVAQTHLRSLGADWSGQIAVFGFYTLSGYLMTRVLNERYGFAWRGTAAFLINRVLRLWPSYCVIMGLALLALQFRPLSNFFFLIRTPHTALDIITNITIVGQVSFDFVQWLPLAKPLVTSWSLSIEMCSYILLGVYFARSPGRLMVFAALGFASIAASTAWCALSSNPGQYGTYCFQNRYGVIQAGFMPFAFGGLFYFYEKSIANGLLKHRGFALAGLACAIGAMFAGPKVYATIGPFIGIPGVWLLLSAARGSAGPTRVQDFFGRASYHLFISHMPLAAVLSVGFGVPAETFTIYVLTVALALALSLLLVPMEHHVNAFRQWIAGTAKTPPTVSSGRPRQLVLDPSSSDAR
jgi:peptidoglycan/LPS O-acetylase OafA/YrhL